MCSILTKGSTCRNISKPRKQVVKYNIPVFISIGQNYLTALYVSKYCFESFYIHFFKNLNYKQLFFDNYVINYVIILSIIIKIM